MSSYFVLPLNPNVSRGEGAWHGICFRRIFAVEEHPRLMVFLILSLLLFTAIINRIKD